MASTKSQAEGKGLMKAVSKSGVSLSRVSAKSRALKNARSQRMIQNKNDTKTVKSIKTVKTADIVNLINGAKLSEKIQANGTTEELTKEKQEDEEEGELIYLDQETGLYYDRHGNLIEFNPDDYIIEE